jgi:hypothetical protein
MYAFIYCYHANGIALSHSVSHGMSATRIVAYILCDIKNIHSCIIALVINPLVTTSIEPTCRMKWGPKGPPGCLTRTGAWPCPHVFFNSKSIFSSQRGNGRGKTKLVNFLNPTNFSASISYNYGGLKATRRSSRIKPSTASRGNFLCLHATGGHTPRLCHWLYTAGLVTSANWTCVEPALSTTTKP